MEILRDRLAQVVTIAGVAITAAAGVLTVGLQGSQARERERCEIARDLLQDEAPTPYLDDAGRRRLAIDALRKIERCLEK